MRFALTLLMGALLALGTPACGSKQAKSAPPASSTFAALGGGASAQNLPYLNDGDAEKKNDHDTDNASANHEDGDSDSVEEYEGTYDNNRYHDGDDSGILGWGHAVSAAEEREIAATVKRYYAAAAAEDGARACPMIVSILAGSVREDYGHGSAGPPYLRSGRTCPATMTLLFRHFHRSLKSPVAVTGARTSGEETRALLGSRTLPASTIAVRRERGAWKIAKLLGAPLP
jgi:hypothetical protein